MEGEDYDNIEERNDEPSCEPECPANGTGEVECEYENRDGSWWCLTHNCYA